MKFAAIAAVAMSVTTTALPLTAFAAPDTPAIAAPRTLLGAWSGVFHQAAGHYSRDTPVSIQVIEKDGGLFMVDNDRSRGGGGASERDRDSKEH